MERWGDETFAENRIEKRRGKDGCGCAMAITEIKKSDFWDVSGGVGLPEHQFTPRRLQDDYSKSFQVVIASP